MRFISNQRDLPYRYNFDFSTNRDFERRMPNNEPTLYFDTYALSTSNREYLMNFLGLKINGDRFSTISTDPTFCIVGKEDVISAIEIILKSKNSFLNLELKPHKKLFNELITFSQSLGGQLQINKIDDTTGYENMSELSDAMNATKSQQAETGSTKFGCSIS